jgi:activating signal cointegrator complex subunit 1
MVVVAHHNRTGISHIPNGALHPIGTLHLTLDVMSLPTKERLDEAVAFFQSLGLACLMREVERIESITREARAIVFNYSKHRK